MNTSFKYTTFVTETLSDGSVEAKIIKGRYRLTSPQDMTLTADAGFEIYLPDQTGLKLISDTHGNLKVLVENHILQNIVDQELLNFLETNIVERETLESSSQIDLAMTKDVVKNKIRRQYKAAIEEDYIDANGMAWNGGEGSANSINGAINLAKNKGESTVELYNKDNQAVNLSLEQAIVLAVAIGEDFLSKYVKKQNLFNQIDAYVDESRKDEILTINW